MIAVSMPDDDAHIIAQDAGAMYSLDKPVNRRMTLDLVVHKDSGLQLRFSLTFQDIRKFVSFVACCLEDPGQFGGRLTGNLMLTYDQHRFGIRQGEQSIEMSQKVAEDLAEALREYAG